MKFLLGIGIIIAVSSAGRRSTVAALSDGVGVAVLDSGSDDAVSRSRRAAPANKNSLTQDERAEFIRAHNDYRRNVQSANNMIQMVWNGGLESMAQEWANQCNWKHGQPTRSNPPFKPIGQNLYAAGGATYTAQAAVQSWYNEVTDYTYDTMSCKSGEVCGHYTQVVWAESSAVGCGIAYCPSITGLSWGGYYIVCNYGPAGNYVGEKPYAVGGGQCSACPSNAPTCNNGLCTTATACGLVTECTTADSNNYCLCDASYYQNQLVPSSAVNHHQKSVRFAGVGLGLILAIASLAVASATTAH